MKGQLLRICAWCTRYLGSRTTEHSAGFAQRGHNVSHGICSECVQHLELDWRERPAGDD